MSSTVMTSVISAWYMVINSNELVNAYRVLLSRDHKMVMNQALIQDDDNRYKYKIPLLPENGIMYQSCIIFHGLYLGVFVHCNIYIHIFLSVPSFWQP